jgi:hypothetical protein
MLKPRWFSNCSREASEPSEQVHLAFESRFSVQTAANHSPYETLDSMVRRF